MAVGKRSVCVCRIREDVVVFRDYWGMGLFLRASYTRGGSTCEACLGERLRSIMMAWCAKPSTRYRWCEYYRYIWCGGASVTQFICELACDTKIFPYR